DRPGGSHDRSKAEGARSALRPAVDDKAATTDAGVGIGMTTSWRVLPGARESGVIHSYRHCNRPTLSWQSKSPTSPLVGGLCRRLDTARSLILRTVDQGAYRVGFPLGHRMRAQWRLPERSCASA